MLARSHWRWFVLPVSLLCPDFRGTQTDCSSGLMKLPQAEGVGRRDGRILILRKWMSPAGATVRPSLLVISTR